eukprot:769620_1
MSSLCILNHLLSIFQNPIHITKRIPNVFENEYQCEISQNTLKCQAINRIQLILHEFNDYSLHKDRHVNQSNLMDKFESIFINNRYTNTSLLNDFHHIKYMHRADDNNEVFSKLYEKFIDVIGAVCNVKQCQFITRHYRDRSVLHKEYIVSEDTQDNVEYNPYDARYMMDLISRIHVYIIHSKINRLKTQQIYGSTLNEVALQGNDKFKDKDKYSVIDYAEVH